MKAAEARAILKHLEENFTITMLVPDLSVDSVKRAISLAKTRSPIKGRINYHSEPSHQEGFTSLSATLVIHAPTVTITSLGLPAPSTAPSTVEEGEDNE